MAGTHYTPDTDGFIETVVQINRVSKKTKGGNTMRFNALVVVGDREGQVGAAIAKARDVRGAIQKAIKQAKLAMITAPIQGTTVPYEIFHKYSAAKVLIKPAPPGSGIIAGGPMRVVLEAAGVNDAVGKILGTNNKTTNVFATIEALKEMSKLQQRKSVAS